jgi:hypothetical protein
METMVPCPVPRATSFREKVIFSWRYRYSRKFSERARSRYRTPSSRPIAVASYEVIE